MVSEEYTAALDRLRYLQRQDPASWEHPRVYDEWMDRAYWGEAVPWGAEPNLPLPPHIAALREPYCSWVDAALPPRKPVVVFRRARAARHEYLTNAEGGSSPSR
jgi:hypothetical protein